MTTGTNESANIHPPGLSSSGVVRYISGAKKLSVENTIEANGTVRINGTRRRDAGFAGRDGVMAVGRRRGRIENLVRRRERPIASGIASGSSSLRDGPFGRKDKRGVRVWITSTISSIPLSRLTGDTEQ
jgi:hypothetical protein